MLTQFDLVEGTVIALKDLSWTFAEPVRIGDTIRVTMQVISVSPHPAKSDRGRVGMRLEIRNQDNTVTSHGTATIVMQTGEE